VKNKKEVKPIPEEVALLVQFQVYPFNTHYFSERDRSYIRKCW